MFRIETGVDKQRRALLGKKLRAANVDRSPAIRGLVETGTEDEVPLQVWAFDAEGQLAGGLAGRVWARWLHVDLLWIDERHRAAGLGTRLLDEAEERARADHGCVSSRLETWDFQAPGFYRKRGYEVIGEVPDYPPGVTEYILVKALV
ncbi:GNAT family N-acetyltransferase [Streptomyces sp. NPDC050504]|uniref:GNAT family N-acetyltransferase n=1 Tax=Streptomyces sp. NPDC050504 TaxID=3365618 RepID=UPI0037B6BD1C